MSNPLLHKASQNTALPVKPAFLERIGVCLAMLLLAAVTVPFLDQQGLWFDEIFSVDTAKSWNGMLQVFAKYENNMALYYILLWAWMHISDSEFFIRLLSVGFALLTVPVFHLLARRLFDLRTALVADMLLVSNSYFVRYASEARSYSLLVLLTTLASLLFVLGTERPRWVTWIAYAMTVAAATYAHYFGFLIIGVHALALFWPLRPAIPWPKMAASVGLLGFLLTPLIIFRPGLAAGQVDWIGRPELGDLPATLTELAGGRVTLIVFMGFLGALVVRLILKRHSLPKGNRGSVNLIFLWLAAPIAATFLFSLFFKPIFVSKYLIGSLPALVLIFAVCVAQFRHRAILLTLALMFSLLVAKNYRDGFSHGAGARDAMQYLAEHAEAGDAIICYPFYGIKPVEFYLSKMKPPENIHLGRIASGTYNPGGGSADPDPDMALVAKLAANHQRVWLFALGGTGNTDFSKRLNRNWTDRITAAVSTELPQSTRLVFGGKERYMRVVVFSFKRAAIAAP